MYISEARAHSCGVDFYVPEKRITIRAVRKPNCEIEVTKVPGIQFNKSYSLKNTTKFKIILLTTAILYSFIIDGLRKYIDIWSFNLILVCAFLWVVMFLYYRAENKNQDSYWEHRYHGAEHKLLNYVDKYKKVPESIDDVKNMSIFSVRCGSTVLTFLLLVATMITLIIWTIPGVILKIIFSILSVFICIFLWGRGNLDFFQRSVVKEPGDAELEVVIAGVKEYAELVNK